MHMYLSASVAIALATASQSVPLFAQTAAYRSAEIIPMGASAAPRRPATVQDAPELQDAGAMSGQNTEMVARGLLTTPVTVFGQSPSGHGQVQPTYQHIASIHARLPAIMPASSAVQIPFWMQLPKAPSARRKNTACMSVPYRPAHFLRTAVESRRAAVYAPMRDAACEFSIPVTLFDALILRESQYRVSVYSPKGAFGLTQLMPGTARLMGVNRHVVADNLRGGARYLREQLDRFGHYHLALAAYNAGPGRIRDGRLPRIAETRAYVTNVLHNWSRFTNLLGQDDGIPHAPHRSAASTVQNQRTTSLIIF